MKHDQRKLDGGERTGEEWQKLENNLFSKIDYLLEVENNAFPHAKLPHEEMLTSQERGDAVGDIFDAVDACLPSLHDSNDREPPGLAGDVAALLISHAEWMRKNKRT